MDVAIEELVTQAGVAGPCLRPRRTVPRVALPGQEPAAAAEPS